MPADNRPSAEPRSLQELTDIVEGLAAGQERHEGLLGELASVVAELAAAPEKPDVVRPWLTLANNEDAQLLLDMLARWLRDVWVRYPGHAGERALPPCWARHPWLVEELWAARGAWREATGPRGSYSRLADWHDRTRPGLTRRIAEHVGTCDAHKHTDGPSSDDPDRPTVDTHDLDAVATAWTTDRTILPSTAHPL